MVNSKKVIAFLTPLMFVFFFLVNPATAQIVYEYDFESGWGNWYADNGIWDVGEPTYGPDSAHSPTNCAGTILDGAYPHGPDSRLISPTIQLPVVNTNEEIVLRFWHWFSYSNEVLSDDNGTVQIRTYENNAWSAWESKGTRVLYSAVWSPYQINLAEYAGKFIQIGFLHVDNSSVHGHHESSGWYIDDININKKTICLWETNVIYGFESGWGCWWTSNGVWEIGEPNSGPGSAYSGSNCAATILDGNYPINTDSYMISPPIDLPAIEFPEEILLRFRQWFSYSTEVLSDDQGWVRIRAYEEGSWSDWITLKTVASYITSWHHERIVLNDYAEKRVQIAFVHNDNSSVHGHHESSGWYIDEVIIETPFTCFTDVPAGHWAEEYICKIYDEGITKGCSQNPLKYCPFDPVTRAQMAAFIVRAVDEGEPPADYCDAGSPFPDVSPDTWPCKYIKRLLELEITKGCGGGNYCPGDTVTRAQMAAFIVRAVEGEPPADYCDTGSPFSDVSPGTWPCKYIKRLLELEITKGCGPGIYCPNNNVTRAEMAAFLARAFLEMD